MSRRTLMGVVTPQAVAVAVGAGWWLVRTPEPGLGVLDLALFCVAAAVMELLPINLREGRGVPTSFAVIGAAAVLGEAPHIVATIALGGSGLAWLVTRRGSMIATLRRRALGGWALSGVAALGAALGPATWYGVVDVGAAAKLNLGAAVGVGLAIVLGVPALDVLTRAGTMWRYAVRRSIEAVREHALVGASVTSTAVLGALVHPVLGHWTLATMLVPLLAARVGLERLALGRRAYDQTIRAMSRLPEHLGTVAAGHGVRVGELARETALELGLEAATVADVTRAAHLHELGRIQLERDTASGQHDRAAAGASVIREVADLERVASIVALHGRKHDGTSWRADEPNRLEADIVAACCELDRYAPDPSKPEQRHEVVVRLVRQLGNLDVVAALTRVVDRGIHQVG